MKRRIRSQAARAPASRTIPGPGVGGPGRDGLRWHAVALALLALMLLAAYANSFGAGFVLDNRAVILDDTRVHQSTAANLRLIFTRDYWPRLVTGVYRPLTTLSFLANYAWLGNGVEPFGYHVVNFVLHALNTGLVYALGLLLLGRAAPAFLMAALFGLHPVATEAVTNLVGRADLLATLTVLTGLVCHVRSQRQASRRAAWLAGLMLSAAVGVFCKESAVTVLAVLIVYDLCFHLERLDPRPMINLLRNLIGFSRRSYWVLLPPLLLMAGVRAWVYRNLTPASIAFVDNPLIGSDFLTARATALGVFTDYLRLLVWPRLLACDYSFDQIPRVTWTFGHTADWKALGGLAAMVALASLAWRLHKRQPLVPLWIAFCGATFLPTSNLIVLIGSIKADRFLYLPSVGFAGLAVLAGQALAQALARRIAPRTAWSLGYASLGLLALTWGARTLWRNRDWQTDERLWTSAARVSPRSYKPYSWLAQAALGEGEAGARIDQALEQAEKARAILDVIPEARLQRPRLFYATLGNYYRIKGDTYARRTPEGSLTPTDAGRPWYEKAVGVLLQAREIDRATNESKRQRRARRGDTLDLVPDTGYDRIYAYLGDTQLRLARYDEAREAYGYQRHLVPARAEAYLKLAGLETARHEPARAMIPLLQAVIVDATQTAAWSQACALHRQAHPDCPAGTPATSSPNLDLNCPRFHDAVCVAYAGLVEVFREARMPGDAETLRRAAAARGCAGLTAPR